IQSANCSPVTVSTDTARQDATCTVTLSDNSIVGTVVPIKRDATPPTITTLTAARAADANGWYNHAVAVSGSGTHPTPRIPTGTTDSGPDSGSATITGTCTDIAGNVSSSKSLTLSYDATAPSVTPAAARPPDANGWYNHAVAVAFQGTDGASGIDSCSSGSYA